MLVVKKYSNRRLYDTSQSAYITLDDLAGQIRAGAEVRVVDAKTGEDLTQSTLTQIILESRKAGRLLPVALLTQLIRMDESSLTEFLGHTMGWALQAYFQARRNMQAMAAMNPFAAMFGGGMGAPHGPSSGLGFGGPNMGYGPPSAYPGAAGYGPQQSWGMQGPLGPSAAQPGWSGPLSPPSASSSGAPTPTASPAPPDDTAAAPPSASQQEPGRAGAQGMDELQRQIEALRAALDDMKNKGE